jgi:putative FmdB family regulatory protein
MRLWKGKNFVFESGDILSIIGATMPTYEYRCEACGHEFERFQSITAEPIKECPLCNRKVKRLFGTGAGIIFRGSGFYATDYRSEDYKAKAKTESSEGAAKRDKPVEGGSKEAGKSRVSED